MNTASVSCRKNTVSFFSPSCYSNLERSISRSTSHQGPSDRSQFFTNFRKRPSTEKLIIYTTPASSFGVISCWNDSPTFNHSKVATSAQEHCLFPRHLWHFIAVPPLQSLVLYLFVMIQRLYPRPRPMLIFSDSFFQRIFTPKKSHSKLQCQTNQRWAAWLELSIRAGALPTFLKNHFL